jgi:hypothetical protein
MVSKPMMPVERFSWGWLIEWKNTGTETYKMVAGVRFLEKLKPIYQTIWHQILEKMYSSVTAMRNSNIAPKVIIRTSKREVDFQMFQKLRVFHYCLHYFISDKNLILTTIVHIKASLLLSPNTALFPLLFRYTLYMLCRRVVEIGHIYVVNMNHSSKKINTIFIKIGCY